MRIRHPLGQHTQHTLSHPAWPWWGELPAAPPPAFQSRCLRPALLDRVTPEKSFSRRGVG